MAQDIDFDRISHVNWIQINDTIVPIICKEVDGGVQSILIPLSVIKHGAGLLGDVTLDTTMSTDQESYQLRELCHKAGFEFMFPASTELIHLQHLMDAYNGKVRFAMLPGDQPFLHAQLQPEDVLCGLEVSKNLSITTRLTTKHEHDGECEPDSPLDLSVRKKTMEDDSLSLEMAVSDINNKNNCTLYKIPLQGTVKYLYGKKLMCLVKDNTDYVELRSVHSAFFYNIPANVFLRIISHIHVPLVNAMDDVIPAVLSIATRGHIPRKMLRFDDAAEMVLRAKPIVSRMKQYLRGQQHAMKAANLRFGEGGPTMNSTGYVHSTKRIKLLSGGHMTANPSNKQIAQPMDGTGPSETNISDSNIGCIMDKQNTPAVSPRRPSLVPDILKRKRLLDTVSKLLKKKKLSC